MGGATALAGGEPSSVAGKRRARETARAPRASVLLALRARRDSATLARTHARPPVTAAHARRRRPGLEQLPAGDRAASRATRSTASTPGARRCASARRSTPRGRLTPTRAAAALACLARFGERIKGLHPSAVRAVATNTFRVAKNAATFLPQAERALGFPIDVITGYEEARLIYIGVAHVLPPSRRAAAGDRHRRRLDRVHHRPRPRARAARVAEDRLRRH